MRASLFVTCLGDVFFPDAAADAVRLMRSLGVEVLFPPGQTCCGQPAFNAGRMELARGMARHTRAVLEGSEDVVLPSGSCATMLRRFYPRLLDGPGDAGATRAASPGAEGPGRSAGTASASATDPPRVWELAEFLVHGLGVDRLGDGLSGLRLAYHPGCHALRELGLRAEAVRLLEGGGAEVVPWEAAEECCGFGGLFAVKLPEVSTAMADRKIDTLPEVDLLTSADPGCLMQLAGRMARRGSAVPVVPLATLLWRARTGAGGAGELRGHAAQ
jgi:L-lactate dehydrogenase complex protein LldE